MAFEGVLARGALDDNPAARRGALVAAFALHAVLVGAGVWRGYWQVDELNPPEIRTVPPVWARLPDLPAAKAGGGRTQVSLKDPPARAPRPPRETKPPPSAKALLPPDAPRETARATAEGRNPTSDDETGGSGRGSGGGAGDGIGVGVGTCVGDHCSDGSGGDGVPTRVLPPTIAAQSCVHCPTPHVPPSLLRVEGKRIMLMKICVGPDGRVTSQTLLRGTPDADVTATIAEWRFRPALVNDRAVPFCYVTRFVFTLE